MAKIIIRNIGPIEDVEFELNKINILMGPQSSGKSTIAKIISYCQWAEKRFLLDGVYEYDINEQLIDFHRLSSGYFTSESYFEYNSEFVKIIGKGWPLDEKFRKKETHKAYKKPKNIYIPSERNFVSVIPNLSKYKETNDNIMAFVYDWFTAKRTFNNTNTLPILNLGINFYNAHDSDNDILLLKNDKEIGLREGSSGLQSIVPLIALIEYLTEYIYEKSISNSVEEKESLNRFIIENLDKFLRNRTIHDLRNNDGIQFTKEEVDAILEAYNKSRSLSTYQKTNFIIEEPEQNLFPSTQRDLVNYLFLKMKDKKDHSLLLTTHSPYILYSVNNCLMGYNVKKDIPEDEKEEYTSINSWTNPEKVSIWQVKEGKLISVKDQRTKTVSKHYFNDITKDIMDEYYSMLNYFKYEE